MKLKNLPEPHILMWDVPPDPMPHSPYPNGILHPCLIGEHHSDDRPPQNKWRKVYFTTGSQWEEEGDYYRELGVEEHIKYRSDIDKLLLKYKERFK